MSTTNGNALASETRKNEEQQHHAEEDTALNQLRQAALLVLLARFRPTTGAS